MASVLDRSFLARVSYVFRGRRSEDGPWSWVVCISAAVCNAINIGFGLSYGILFPELMSCFGETIERTGEWFVYKFARKKRTPKHCIEA